MHKKREHESKPTREENPPDAEPRSEKRESAEKASASTDDVLADIDQLLLTALGVDQDENVDVDERARKWVEDYIQKGGQ